MHTAADLCSGSDRELAACLTGSLSRYWTRRLGRRIDADVTLGFRRRLIPPVCRRHVDRLRWTAFTCPPSLKVFVGPLFLRHLHEDRPPRLFPDRLAAVLGHEVGHVVQYTVDEPLVHRPQLNAISRVVEQQADCLSGVWAAAVGLDGTTFLDSARTMLADVNRPGHARDHGTIPVRMAAIRRGMVGGLRACSLRVGA